MQIGTINDGRSKQNSKTMKRMIQIPRLCRCLVGLAMAAGFTAMVWQPVQSYAAEGTAKGGATKLIQLKPIKTAEDAQAVEAGDTMVMSCPKCKDSWITVVGVPAKGSVIETKQVLRHECPGCSARIVTEGHGKAKTTKVIHVCKNCGSEDAFCCVMKKGAGPTPGMEKK